MKTETAHEKLNNLQTLQKMQAQEINPLPVSVDEDGFYYVGNEIFVDFKSALKSIKQ